MNCPRRLRVVAFFKKSLKGLVSNIFEVYINNFRLSTTYSSDADILFGSHLIPWSISFEMISFRVLIMIGNINTL